MKAWSSYAFGQSMQLNGFKWLEPVKRHTKFISIDILKICIYLILCTFFCLLIKHTNHCLWWIADCSDNAYPWQDVCWGRINMHRVQIFILKHLCSHDKWSLTGNSMGDDKEMNTHDFLLIDNINNVVPVKTVLEQSDIQRHAYPNI